MLHTNQAPRRRFWKTLPTLLIIGAVMILGGAVRFFQVSYTDFPLNDGGMFYRMTEDLIQAHYRLPPVTSYNYLQIPFAYPPLSFYLAGFLSQLTHSPLLDIFRVLPAVISTLTIPVFYRLSRQLLRSQLQAVFATFVFALLPESLSWLIYGGGVARATGLFFALIALHQAYLMYTRQNSLYVVSTGLFTALAIMSHPQLGWSTSYSIGLFLLFYGRTWLGVRKAFAAAMLTVVFAAPWWLDVVTAHGFAPLIAALQTGTLVDHLSNFLLLFLGIGFVGQAFWGFLGSVGIVRLVAERAYFLPVWIAAIFLLEPRVSVAFIAIPLGMVIGIVIVEVILLPIEQITRRSSSPGTSKRRNDAQRLLPRFLLFLFLLGVSITTALDLSIPRIGHAERDAMQWVSENTAPESLFALVTHSGAWYNDNVGEWFPVLAQRQSIMTVQGTEWFAGFTKQIEAYNALQACATQDAACLESWATGAGKMYTYVFLKGAGSEDYSLRTSLSKSPYYQIVYNGAGAVIFKRRVGDFNVF